MAIDKIAGFAGSIGSSPSVGATVGESAGAGFGDTLNRLVQAVETSGADANTAVSQMVEGTGDVHDAMIALQRADLTFQLSMQVRNKLVQAYQEIMRMPV
jgi:flagellar hook-basal body complex protein FliE